MVWDGAIRETHQPDKKRLHPYARVTLYKYIHSETRHMFKFNIGSDNWEQCFDVDVVDADGNIVLNVVIDYTTLSGDCQITLANFDDTKVSFTNAHAFYAAIAAEIEAQIQQTFFGGE